MASAALALGAPAACSKIPGEPAPAAAPDDPAVGPSTCGNVGALEVVLSGAISATLDWPDEEMQCESMPRPGTEGVRLRFSGEVAEERLAVIVAMPGLAAGATGEAFDSNVTISVEGSGRFFSTPNLDTCWASVAVNEPLEHGSGVYVVQGDLSCVGPLGEVNGNGYVDILQFRFSGTANWEGK